MATLVNGNGNVAVYAQQDADLLTGALGASTRIMNVGSKMAYTIEDANTIAVADGVILTKEGRRIQVDVGNVDEFTIPTGSAGVTRYYIIGYHLYTDGSANQKCETFVQLMSNGSETITENTFRNGASEVYVSLYRVKQIGLNLDTITALLSVGIALTDMTDVIGDTDISGIGDGTLTGGLNAVNQNLTELTDLDFSSVDSKDNQGASYTYTPAKSGLLIAYNSVATGWVFIRDVASNIPLTCCPAGSASMGSFCSVIVTKGREVVINGSGSVSIKFIPFKSPN